ncbi:MAG: DUF2934 domain-containing protein [Acidobacteria bacterium]|nr:DUF2934 domain-containing protein [Acidobacteriota bacterium]
MAKKNSSPETPAAPPRQRATTRRGTAGAATPASTAAETRRDPTHDEIAKAAYQRYLSRGGEHGRDFDDWLDAERDLRQRKSQ